MDLILIKQMKSVFVSHVWRKNTTGGISQPVEKNVPRNHLAWCTVTKVCGKMNAESLSGAEYFLTFIDDKTRYVWMYVLKLTLSDF